MKFKLFVLLSILFFGCAKKIYKRDITINSSVLNHNFQKPMLIMSCIRCGCFIDMFRKIDNGANEALLKYDIYYDSLCIRPKPFTQKTNHISSKTIDSLYDEHYNVILIKKDSKTNNYKAILIETIGSTKFESILINFLK